MIFRYHKTNDNSLIAELTDESFLINEVQDVLDLFGSLGPSECNKIIIRKHNLSEDFFDLKTRLAGDILQKFSNYGLRLSIIGDFSKYTSKSLRDFMGESNRGNMISFVESLESALSRLR